MQPRAARTPDRGEPWLARSGGRSSVRDHKATATAATERVDDGALDLSRSTGVEGAFVFFDLALGADDGRWRYACSPGGRRVPEGMPEPG
jgi:hypothetical protein